MPSVTASSSSGPKERKRSFGQAALTLPSKNLCWASSELYGGRRADLLQLCEFLGCELNRFWAGIILLDLLVNTLGIQRLVAGLVQLRQLQLCRRFAHRSRRMVDEILV